jgi:hypothetical protein
MAQSPGGWCRRLNMYKSVHLQCLADMRETETIVRCLRIDYRTCPATATSGPQRGRRFAMATIQ